MDPNPESMKLLMRLIVIGFAVSAALMCSGCGTFVGRQYPSLRPEKSLFYPYSATQADFYGIIVGGMTTVLGNEGRSEIPPRWMGFVMVPFSLLDLPISLTTDTVLLPLDLARRSAAARCEEIEKERASRTFYMTIGVETANAPGIILVDVSCMHHDRSQDVTQSWAEFRCVSTGCTFKVKEGELFGCADSPERYKLVSSYYYPTSVEKQKLPPDTQHTVGGDRKSAPQP